jgi:hypothetical protein
LTLTGSRYKFILIICVFLLGCASKSSDSAQTPAPESADILIQDLDIAVGQTIYVPAYSEIYFAGEDRTLDLAVTLSIHNTDFEHPIIITSVRYYNTQGELVKEYLPQPRRLNPLASTDFFVGASEQSGGLGTNFIVEWVAEQPVYEPIVETIMLSTAAAQGISFTSPGRVIRQLNN